MFGQKEITIISDLILTYDLMYNEETWGFYETAMFFLSWEITQ